MRPATVPGNDLHERPADKRDDDHGQPRRHLGETIGEVAVRDSEVVLLHGAIEGVEVAPVRLNLSNLIVDNELLDRLRSSGSAVQCLVASDRDRRRLVGERLRDLEEVQRRRVNGPRVAQNTLGFAVQVRELGRVGHGCDQGGRGLEGCISVAFLEAACCGVRTFQALVALPQRPKHVLLPPVVKTSQSWVVGGLAVGSTVKTSFQFSRVNGCWTTSTTLAAASLAAASTGADGIEAEMVEDTAADALLKKPLTLSRMGICCSSAIASAGRARRMPDETRIVPCVCAGRTGRGKER